MKQLAFLLILILHLPSQGVAFGPGLPSSENLAMCLATASLQRTKSTCVGMSCSPLLSELYSDSESSGFVGNLYYAFNGEELTPYRNCQVEKQLEDRDVKPQQILEALESDSRTSISSEFKSHLLKCTGKISHRTSKVMIARAYQGATRLSAAAEATLIQIAESDRLLGRKPLENINCSLLTDRATKLCQQLKACTSSDEERETYFQEAESLLQEAQELKSLRKLASAAAIAPTGPRAAAAREEFRRLLQVDPPEDFNKMVQVVSAKLQATLSFNPLLLNEPFWSSALDLIDQRDTRTKLRKALQKNTQQLQEKLLQFQTAANCFDPRFSSCEICSYSNYMSVLDSAKHLNEITPLSNGLPVSDAHQQAFGLLSSQACVDELTVGRNTADSGLYDAALGSVPVLGAAARFFKFYKVAQGILKTSMIADGIQSSRDLVNGLQECSNTLKIEFAQTRERGVCSLGQTGTTAYRDYTSCIVQLTGGGLGALPPVAAAILHLPRFAGVGNRIVPGFVNGRRARTIQEVVENFKTATISDRELKYFNKLITEKSPEVKAVVFQENAILKPMNDNPALLKKDKDLATALSNLHHSMFLEIVNADPNLKKAILAVGTETKTNAVLLNTNDPLILRGFEDALLAANKKFADLIKSGLLAKTFNPSLLRENLAKDPLNWFQSGLGANFEEASQAARANRRRHVPGTQRVARYAEIKPLLIETFESQKAGLNQIQSFVKRSPQFEKLMVKTAAGDYVPSLDAVEILRRTMSLFPNHPNQDVFYAALKRNFEYRYGGYSPSREELLVLRNFYEAHNQLSPALIPGPRTLPNIETSVFGVFSFDRAGMGAQNIATQMRLASRSETVEEFMGLSRQGEQSVTSDVVGWRTTIGDRSRRIADPARTGCSGEDCLAIANRRVTEADIATMIRSFVSSDPIPSQTRLTFLEPRNVRGAEVPPADRATWIAQAESLEKALRQRIRDARLLPYNILDQTLMMVRITPATGKPDNLAGAVIEVIAARAPPGEALTAQRETQRQISEIVRQELARLASEQRFGIRGITPRTGWPRTPPPRAPTHQPRAS